MQPWFCVFDSNSYIDKYVRFKILCNYTNMELYKNTIVVIWCTDNNDCTLIIKALLNSKTFRLFFSFFPRRPAFSTHSRVFRHAHRIHSLFFLPLFLVPPSLTVTTTRIYNFLYFIFPFSNDFTFTLQHVYTTRWKLTLFRNVTSRSERHVDVNWNARKRMRNNLRRIRRRR